MISYEIVVFSYFSTLSAFSSFSDRCSSMSEQFYDRAMDWSYVPALAEIRLKLGFYYYNTQLFI